MKVIIKRSSVWGVEPGSKPVDGARIETVWVIDERNVPSIFEYDALPNHRPWASTGRNHRETGRGTITREVPEIHWVIDIDDLWEFSARVGHQLVVGTTIGFPMVEIYDDYRE